MISNRYLCVCQVPFEWKPYFFLGGLVAIDWLGFYVRIGRLY